MNNTKFLQEYTKLREDNEENTSHKIRDILTSNATYISDIIDDPKYIVTRYRIHCMISYVIFHIYKALSGEDIYRIQSQVTGLPEEVFQEHTRLMNLTFAGGWEDRVESEASIQVLADFEDKYPDNTFSPELQAFDSLIDMPDLHISKKDMISFISLPNQSDYAYKKIQHFLDTSPSLQVRCPEKSSMTTRQISSLFVSCFGQEIEEVFY